MDPVNQYIIPLEEAAEEKEHLIGGKSAKLAQLLKAGYRIPNGFSITIHAYQYFLTTNHLEEIIRFEIGRKSFNDLRWEEIWDAALRIRSAFKTARIPPDLQQEIVDAYITLGRQSTLAVRSSAPKEDSAQASFAGLHESYVDVKGEAALCEAVKLVWASLWSDAALLYQHELGLDPTKSNMAVVVQKLVQEDISGVAFGRDPRNISEDRVIIEAVPGLCGDLVDGIIDPDRWILSRSSGNIEEMRTGVRDDQPDDTPLLSAVDLKNIYHTLQGIEDLFKWSPDIEWTGKGKWFTLLQARPITTSNPKAEDKKSYYLTLRPGKKRLRALAQRVSEKLIPELISEGDKFAAEDLGSLTGSQLCDHIEARQISLEKWKEIYRDEFIPFAHGVRHLATYYNDAVNPDDPYEFLGLLKGQEMISVKRNQMIQSLAEIVNDNPEIGKFLQKYINQKNIEEHFVLAKINNVGELQGGEKFVEKFKILNRDYLDISHENKRLKNRPDLVFKIVLELAEDKKTHRNDTNEEGLTRLMQLEQKLFDAVIPNQRQEAREVLDIGRLSWRLRDDDNLLLNRIESQFLRALEEGAHRLKKSGRLKGNIEVKVGDAKKIIHALRNPEITEVILPREHTEKNYEKKTSLHEKPRQLVGQPAAPGIITGKVRCIRETADLGKFRRGEILVCDAVQPNMTHLVPLASAIIERRGGMLIHGAIIAREMGIPCVNGIPKAAELLNDGDIVTVDGNLGIVTIGEPEFELELNIR